MVTPLNTIEGDISEGRRKNLNQGIGTEDLIKIVSDASESVIELFQSTLYLNQYINDTYSLSSPKLNGRPAWQGDEPVETVHNKKNHNEEAVRDKNEVHQSLVLSVGVMCPNSHNCKHVVAESHQKVKTAQKEVSVVLKSKTIVYPSYY